MIRKKLNSSSMSTFGTLNVLLIHFAFAFLIEFDQQQSLVLDRGEQVMLPDEVEYMRTPQAEEVW